MFAAPLPRGKRERRAAPWLAAALAAVFLLASSMYHRPLVGMREARRSSDVSLENAPPLVAFTTIVLGGFRGILADILWLRISHLQDAGRYVEVVQLSDWITKLEPHFSEVWSYHAWNMAYNVSVMMPAPEDRWRWVRNGLQLLRDEGIRLNPDDSRLPVELAWIYHHKIGGIADQAHSYYRRELARDMSVLFPGGRVDYAALAADPERLRVVTETHRLDPLLMREVDALYGPLDWRLPDTHAVYWSQRSRKRAGARDLIFGDRMLVQSLWSLVRDGQLAFDPVTGTYATSPFLEIIPKVLKAYRSALDRHDHEGLESGYRNFVKDITRLLTEAGRENELKELLP
jgi:hypothetical protein